MKIFISYRRKDSGRDIGRIRDRLKAAFGEQSVFRDLVDIPAGVDFRTFLEKETNGCKVMLVVIGPQWASITGENGTPRLFESNDYTRIEIETGLKRLKNKEATVIPVLISSTQMPSRDEIPESIGELTYQNGINIRDDPDFDHDIERLIRDIRSSQGFREDDIKIAEYEPKTIYFAEGSFWMGINGGEGIPIYETPRHEVTLPAYRIGKFPVTNAQYQVFIDKTKTLVTRSMRWVGQMMPDGQEEVPVTGVTWYEALAYCRWLSNETGRTYQLPNEAQWEKACRGGNKYFYPWGNEFDPARSNHGNSEVAPVDPAKPAQNDYGGYDFVGNIRQWTCSLWGEKHPAPEPKYAYPWKNDRRNDVDANNQIRRVIKGSSFKEEKRDLRCSIRNGQAPEQAVWRDVGIGFRVVMIV